MACGMTSRTFLLTVTSDDVTVDDGLAPASTTSSKAGLWVPFSDYLVFADFTALRVSVEVVSITPNMVMEIGARTSNDGSTIVSVYGFAGDNGYANLTAVGWKDYPFFDVMEDEKYFQGGVFARLSNGSSVPGTPGQMAVIRVVLSFKSSLTRWGGE